MREAKPVFNSSVYYFFFSFFSFCCLGFFTFFLPLVPIAFLLSCYLAFLICTSLLLLNLDIKGSLKELALSKHLLLREDKGGEVGNHIHLVLLLRLLAEAVPGRRSSASEDSTIFQNSSLSAPVTTACSWASLKATG